MAVTNRTELIQYCLRKLGEPVISVNVAAVQIEDRVDEALAVYQEKHYDATVSDWVYYEITQEDIDSGYITIPDDILVVIDLLPMSAFGSQGGMFSFQYQIAQSSLNQWRPFDQIDYFMKMADFESILNMTSVTPRIEFSRHERKLKVYSSLEGMGVGYKLGAHVQRIIDPYNSTVFDDKWLKEYTSALIKRQWGENLKKMSGVTLLGGIELNGQTLFDEAIQDIERLEDTLESTYSTPVDFFMG